MRDTSLTATMSHDNNNHRTSKHASRSWRSDCSPSCLGGSSHGWVPVKTHCTPVPTCGLLTNSTTHNNESKKTQHNNNSAIVEGDLFRSARSFFFFLFLLLSSSFFLLSFFFSHPVFFIVGRSDVLGRAPGMGARWAET